MKAFKKLLIFIAVVLVLVGGILIGIGIKNRSFEQTYGERVETIYEPEAEFNDISIKADISDFVIVKSEDDKVRITCDETEKIFSKVNVSNNTLYIEQKDTRAWYEKIVVFTFPWHKALLVTVALPKDEYQKFTLDQSTGDLSISDISFDDVNVKKSTGDIEVKNVNVVNTLSLTTSTGDVAIENVKAKEALVKTSTGTEILKNVITTERINLKASTGDIKFSGIDSKSITIKTSTGDIRGDVLTAKTFKVHGDEVKYPNTTGDECIAETSIGDVYITISNN